MDCTLTSINKEKLKLSLGCTVLILMAVILVINKQENPDYGKLFSIMVGILYIAGYIGISISYVINYQHNYNYEYIYLKKWQILAPLIALTTSICAYFIIINGDSKLKLSIGFFIFLTGQVLYVYTNSLKIKTDTEKNKMRRDNKILFNLVGTLLISSGIVLIYLNNKQIIHTKYSGNYGLVIYTIGWMFIVFSISLCDEIR